MKKNKFGLICGAVLLTATAWAANEIFNDKSEASIQIQRQDPGLQVETKEVKYITSYLGDYSKKILLKVTTNLKINTGLDGSEGASSIEARSENDFYATPLWTVSDQGQEVRYQNDGLIRSIRYGCCGDFTRSTLYNVETGQSPATYLDEDFYTISVPNSGLGNRYMAQVDDPSAPKTRNGKDYIGSIAYLEDSRKIAIARFYAKVTPGWGTQIAEVKLVNLAGPKSKNAFRDKELELWDSDGNKDAKSAFKGFAMTGTIDFDNKHLTLQVPVSGDQIDEAHIKVSSGLEFEVLY